MTSATAANQPASDQPAASTPWHARTVEAVLDELDATTDGLSTEEAERRLDEYGPNEIRGENAVSPLRIFLSQFQDVLIYLLVLAALLSLAVGLLPGETANVVDAALILVILAANGVFGFVQDYRAERSMQRLRELASPAATVVRDGERRTVDATAVVPGDVVVLEQGDAVPADARLVESTNLETAEAALTGESANVGKDATPVDAGTSLAERRNMVYMNTNAVRGRARAVVVGTGMDTEVGSIATQMQAAEDGETPFQAEVDELGRRIGLGVLALISLVVLVQFLFTETDAISIFLTAVTLAVAAVPEGLPAIVTLTLALGSQKLIERNALVRRLPVVESLGSVDTILTDKTGTLTESQMTVQRVAAGDDVYDVTGAGLETDGEFVRDGDPVDPAVLEPVLRCGARCNNAEPAPDTEDRAYFGDPTEVALLVSALKAGVERDADRVREVPFSSDRKRMTVVVEGPDSGDDVDEGTHTAYMKGAPEVVLDRCDRVLVDGAERDLTDADRDRILDRTESFASDALRVIGFAHRRVADPDVDADALEDDMVFLGLQGMLDPPRDEVPRAVADCRDAGIRVVMATGDNVETAKAIGEEIGFDPTGAITGAEVEALTDAELQEVVETVEVFARVAPEHKVRILDALQANGHRVAMTGDGVNDAPGVRNADVGISMGERGTDVTKEASDMILQDDNFATIRDAIAEGRGIFDNIRKFVNYLLSANAGEVLVVFAGVLVGSALYPSLFAGNTEALVLTPVMLLWINLVTDGFPALALGTDPKADGIMARAPRGDDDPVIDRRMTYSIGTIAVIMTITGLSLFLYALEVTRDLVVAQTLLFTLLVTVEMVRIHLIRSRYDLSPLSNPWLVAAVILSLALQLAVLYTPLRGFFSVVAPSLTHWTWIGGAFLAFVALALVAESHVERTAAS
ncbi:cation-translocating P-type ATPase [Halorubellus sp. PRR65]|uniref:cation-translocating P-type ATPase n=1 Tax=Halorubellus sp. PRR65 TaxID=3098148 RepID=UPI002B2625E2|nr:cation-translocating P-type ATPase [Halorubellus sp. PRR65]